MLRLHYDGVQADYGGAQTYVEWANPSNSSTVTQFYQDSSLQVSLFSTACTSLCSACLSSGFDGRT